MLFFRSLSDEASYYKWLVASRTIEFGIQQNITSSQNPTFLIRYSSVSDDLSLYGRGRYVFLLDDY